MVLYAYKSEEENPETPFEMCLASKGLDDLARELPTNTFLLIPALLEFTQDFSSLSPSLYVLANGCSFVDKLYRLFKAYNVQGSATLKIGKVLLTTGVLTTSTYYFLDNSNSLSHLLTAGLTIASVGFSLWDKLCCYPRKS